MIATLSGLLLLTSLARAGCEEVDAHTLESHAGWARMAWREGDAARFDEAHRLMLEDLDCLAGSGLSTRDTDIFMVLARGALEAGDDERALAALRAVLVLQGDYLPDPALVPLDEPLAPLFAMAQVLGPDVAGFRALFLGQDAASPPPPPAQPPPPSAAELEALRREELLARLAHERAVDARAHKVGAITAAVGGITCGLSLSFIAARNTSGESKETVQDRPQREIMGKVWQGTAVAGAVTRGAGLWLVRASQLDAGPTVGVGWGARF